MSGRDSRSPSSPIATGFLNELLDPEVYGWDHRGRRVRIAADAEVLNDQTGAHAGTASRAGSKVTRNLTQWIRWMTPHRSGGSQSSWPIAVLVFVAIWLFGASVVAPRLHVHVAVGAGIALGVYLVLTFVSRSVGPRREERRRAVPRITRELLLSRRCASCEQSLEGLAKDGDGCCVCAECGSAWDLEAIGAESRRLGSRAIPDRADGFLQQVRVADVRGWQRPIMVTQSDAEARGACRAAGQSLPRFWRSADGAASACAVFFCVALTASRGYSSLTASGIVLAICTPIVASFYWSYRNKRRTGSVELLARSMIQQGKCPCCEVDLPAENAALIDAKVCVACGAAWDPARVTAVARGEGQG